MKIEKFLENEEDGWLAVEVEDNALDVTEPEEADDEGFTVVDDTPEADKDRPVAEIDPDNDEEVDVAAEIEETLKRNKVPLKNRIGQLTAEKHAYRRAAEERERHLQAVLDYTNKLRARLEETERILPAGYGIVKDANLKRAEAELQFAKAEYAKAMEAGDTAQAAELADRMARINAHREQVLQIHVPDKPNAVPDLPQFQYSPTPSNTDMSWAERNPWFFENTEMKNAAMAVHNKLLAEKIAAGSDEYYAKIDSEIRAKFPEHFASRAPGKAQTRTAASDQPRAATKTPTAPVSRAGSVPGKRTKRQLTSSEKAICDRLGLDYAGYLKEVESPGSTLAESFKR